MASISSHDKDEDAMREDCSDIDLESDHDSADETDLANPEEEEAGFKRCHGVALSWLETIGT